jgi:hypothetical protein
MLKIFKKTCCLFMITTVFMLNMPMPHAYAAMVGTEQVVQTQTAELERSQIVAFLDRAEVQEQLQLLNVDSDEAKARVNSMTDNEVRMLAGKIDHLPAGGGAVSTVISAFLIVFLVLLFTDIMGFTDVFPFVKAQK